MPMNPGRYRFTVDWFSAHGETWSDWLNHLRHRPRSRFLEIGCFEGRATVWLLENVLDHPTCRIDCVDTFEGSPEHSDMGLDLSGVEARFDWNVRASGSAHKVGKLKGASREHLRRLPFDAYDFAYVDGSHLARDVLEDAVLAFPLLKKGALLVFDDYRWDRNRGTLSHPGPGIDAFLAIYSDPPSVRAASEADDPRHFRACPIREPRPA